MVQNINKGKGNTSNIDIKQIRSFLANLETFYNSKSFEGDSA